VNCAQCVYKRARIFLFIIYDDHMFVLVRILFEFLLLASKHDFKENLFIFSAFYVVYVGIILCI